MLNTKTLWGSLAGLVIFSNTSGAVLAKMPASTSDQTSQFQPIEQPLALKIGVTIGGLALIGLELWWFLLSKSPALPPIAELTKKK
ncbi:hypothetical protein [Cylindrospermum sp. FACHB-282]|uniref:hypothetical protein n=1 Tax=Cylindrospermum sp. FACHB-282 TaxID=2692794 RepID=UPI001683DD30|nr:hypothetical protein [Cylindrospermum sp. FACHB-282]MBD2386696.1 hypothetical protein [Cylindrospermum sp. FACHB-282]